MRKASVITFRLWRCHGGRRGDVDFPWRPHLESGDIQKIAAAVHAVTVLKHEEEGAACGA